MGYLNSLKRMFEIGWPNAERIYRQRDASPVPKRLREESYSLNKGLYAAPLFVSGRPARMAFVRAESPAHHSRVPTR